MYHHVLLLLAIPQVRINDMSHRFLILYTTAYKVSALHACTLKTVEIHAEFTFLE